ncbi:lytic transglycosylase domain-containing protein, partial [Acidobacteriota bacterium]
MKKIRYINILTISAILLFVFGCATQTPTIDTSDPAQQGQPEKQAEETEVKAKNTPPLAKEEKTEVITEADTRYQEIELKETVPSELLDSAMDAYQDAQAAWNKGDMDTALVALDEAYRLLLQTNLPEDSPLIQEKDELRFLIAQRIQEIYASRLTVAGENHQSIPLVENSHVLAEIKSFQNRERKDFELSYQKSGWYREYILKELRDAGLPEELSWMPMIESWFKTNAYSRARAMGLWQFIASTGYRYGLKRDRYIDERMDFIRASRAAVKYLSELHTMFGDWTTALAAYNCGEFRVQRVIKNQRLNYLDNFWDLYKMLPRETARFVPRFIATILIINSPEKYGFDLPSPNPQLQFDII